MGNDRRAKAQGSYLAIARRRIRDEGATGTLDQAVPIVLDSVPVGSRAIRTDHARAGPDGTRVLVVDQFTDQFPRLLQLAGEAGDFGGVHVRVTSHTTPPALRAPRPPRAVRPPNLRAGSPAVAHRSPPRRGWRVARRTAAGRGRAPPPARGRGGRSA